MSKQGIAIYSAGGFGREVGWLLSSLEDQYNIIGFVDDGENLHGHEINGLKVFSKEQLVKSHPGCLLSCAIGAPAVRENVVKACETDGFTFETLIHPNVEISEFVSLGEGCIICAGSIITVNIEIAEHVHINLDCTIGHDVKIGSYTTISPGVHISGNVHIGSAVYLGTGANIINGTSENPLVIADGTVVGAGACITKSTDPDSLYAGVPAVRKK